MSSKLAQFLHRERYQAATIVMNIAQVRQSVDELICVLFPQRGCRGAGGLENIEAQLLELKRRFNHYLESLTVLNADLQTKGPQIVEDFFNQLPETERSPKDLAPTFKTYQHNHSGKH